MLDIIYYFNIFGCLTMGMALLLIQTAPQLINPHYRNAKRFLGIASIIGQTTFGREIHCKAVS